MICGLRIVDCAQELPICVGLIWRAQQLNMLLAISISDNDATRRSYEFKDDSEIKNVKYYTNMFVEGTVRT